jgi:predicted nucleic-acid-binding Zn-ribbon protein
MRIFHSSEPETVHIHGRALKCPVCGNGSFRSRKAQLNTSVATFFGLDWANRSATCYVCTQCAHISWFLND